MPCSYFIDTGDAYSQGYKDGQSRRDNSPSYTSEELDRLEKDVIMQKLDKVTRLLCYVMSSDRFYSEGVDSIWQGDLGHELSVWWSYHKLVDAERKTYEGNNNE